MRRLLLLRHGQTAWNLEGRWQGWLDVELDDVGVEQARLRARWVREQDVAFAGVASSPLLRAYATARIVADALGHADVHTHPGLRERHGGDWQGLTSADISVRYAEQFAALKRGEMDGPPGGESTAEMLARLDRALAEVDASMPAGPIVLVTHGGIARALAQRAGAPSSSVLANVGGMWLDYDGGAHGSVVHAGDTIPPLAEDPAYVEGHDPVPVAPEIVASGARGPDAQAAEPVD